MSAGDQCPVCGRFGYHFHGEQLVTTLPDAIEQIREERDTLRRRVEERAHDCANVEAERDRLREQLVTHLRTSDYLRQQMEPCEMHDGARRACGQCLSSREAELAEIKRVLIAFHRQEGEGILAVKRLAKRIYEASASQADLTGERPTSPLSPVPSYVCRPMTQAEVEAQVEKNRWGTDE